MKNYSRLLASLLGSLLLTGLFSFQQVVEELHLVRAAPQQQASPLSVIISEIAWSGTKASTADEWIELYNPSNYPVDLTGWRLVAIDGSPDILLNGILPPDSFFLLERSNDNTVLDVEADLIYSGASTTAEYMSGSKPIPRSKPEIAAATALAAEYLGMSMVYLEGGSGAQNSVPNEMVRLVSETCSIPVIVGGGIRNSKTAKEKVDNGAKVIVTGNYFEDRDNWHLIEDFSNVIHS